MASFQIHEDQENSRIPELRQKRANMAPVQQKRTVLGALENQQIRRNPLGEKQPLGDSKLQIGIGNENIPLKQAFNKLPPPVVPVAQFEAFKVYEDSKESDGPAARKTNSSVDAADTEYASIKKEWFAQEAKIREESLKILAKKDETEETKDEPEVEGDPAASKTEMPMSIEKPVEDECMKLLIKNPSNKDLLFFENEEYRADIYLYLREHELHNRPKPGYMRKQPDITYNMRTILVDWLVEVVREYEMHTETLYLAVNYIDRFLSYMSVVRGKLQLVGTAAMYIAAKYEEIYPPEIKEFVYITDDTYTKKQVLRMEHLILKVLSFDLSVPTPLTFINAICMATGMPKKILHLAMYLSELSMLEADAYLETLPSVLGLAAVAVARYAFKLEPWTADLKRKTGYDAKDLKKTMEFLYILFCKAPAQAHQAIREKYNSPKYSHVSQLNPRSEDIIKLSD